VIGSRSWALGMHLAILRWVSEGRNQRYALVVPNPRVEYIERSSRRPLGT
jgi:hypothetical protein